MSIFKTVYKKWNPVSNSWDSFYLKTSADMIEETTSYKVLTSAERGLISDYLSSVQNPNKVLAGPATGSTDGIPTYRALGVSDIPSLSTIYLPLGGGTMTGDIQIGSNKLKHDSYSYIRQDGQVVDIYTDNVLTMTINALGTSHDMKTRILTNLGAPAADQDAATKKYVDDLVAVGTRPASAPVVAATTANIYLSAPQTIDGISVTVGDRVLAKNQTAPSQNGIYTVAAGSWTKASSDSEEGILVFIESGAINNDYLYYNTDGTTWVVFSRVDTVGVITAGGLEKTGTDLGIKTSGVTNTMLAGSIAWSKLIDTQLNDTVSWTSMPSVTSNPWGLKESLDTLLSSIKLIRGTSEYNSSSSNSLKVSFDIHDRRSNIEVGCVGAVIATVNVTIPTSGTTGIVIDGYTTQISDYVILLNQTLDADNGIYFVFGHDEWTKTADILQHTYYAAENGTANADKLFFCLYSGLYTAIAPTLGAESTILSIVGSS